MGLRIVHSTSEVAEYSAWADIKQQLNDVNVLADLRLSEQAMQAEEHLGSSFARYHVPRGTLQVHQTVWDPWQGSERAINPMHFRIVANLLTKDGDGPLLEIFDYTEHMDKPGLAWSRATQVRPGRDEKGRELWRKAVDMPPVIGMTDQGLEKIQYGMVYEAVFAMMVASSGPNASEETLATKLTLLAGANVSEVRSQQQAA